MRLRVDGDRVRTEGDEQAVEPLVQDPRGALAGREVPGRPVEQVRPRVLHAQGLGARDRMAADEALVLGGRRNGALRGAHVGHHAIRSGEGQRLGAQLRERAHGRAQERGLRVRQGVRHGRRGTVDRPALGGHGQHPGIHVEAGHVAVLLAGREPHRSPDQADADDRHAHTGTLEPLRGGGLRPAQLVARRARTASASRSSVSTDASHPMHSSVIDWP